MSAKQSTQLRSRLVHTIRSPRVNYVPSVSLGKTVETSQARSWESPEQGRGIPVGFFKSSMSDPENHASGWRPRLPDPQPRASFASSPVSTTRPNIVAAEGEAPYATADYVPNRHSLVEPEPITPQNNRRLS